MPFTYPQRTDTHLLEDASERFFHNCLPGNWTYEKPSHDYGVDLKVDLFNQYDATGLELLVQLKSSHKKCGGDYETIELKISTYNYLWEKLQVVILVKYVEETKKAYWELLSNVPEPNYDNKSLTIRIPKTQDLETIDWDRIYTYVRLVTDKKLSATERNVFEKYV